RQDDAEALVALAGAYSGLRDGARVRFVILRLAEADEDDPGGAEVAADGHLQALAGLGLEALGLHERGELLGTERVGEGSQRPILAGLDLPQTEGEQIDGEIGEGCIGKGDFHGGPRSCQTRTAPT